MVAALKLELKGTTEMQTIGDVYSVLQDRYHNVPRSCLINCQDSKLTYFRQGDTDDFILKLSHGHFLALREELPVWTLFLRQRELLEGAQVHEVEIRAVVPVVLHILFLHFCVFDYDELAPVCSQCRCCDKE